MPEAVTSHGPLLTDQGLNPTSSIQAVDEYGETRDLEVAGERPLTLYLDKREIVTLMTLGGQPELLALGYLRNQGLVTDIRQIRAVQVDWDVAAVAVTSFSGTAGQAARLDKRTVTTGCGQGTVFGDLMESLEQISLPVVRYRQSEIYALLRAISAHNEVYKQAGAVHGCALCQGLDILRFVEDVGRHNAVDAIAGWMWLEDVSGADKIFYTTGRLTSEMVIKVAQIGVPWLLSRSGVTRMGLEIAQRLGVTLIGRAKGKHFFIYHGAENLDFDAIPASQRMGSVD